MEAIGFYDYCLLRYSNRYIFGVLETQPSFNWSSEVIVNNTNQYERELVSLLDRLVTEAAWQSQRKKFAVGESDKTYALVQCSEDLSSLNCSICLDLATSDILNCCGWETGAQIHMPGCNIRFENYKFYNSTPGGPAMPPPSSPAPLPPPRNNSTGKGESNILVAAGVGVGAGGIIVVLSILICLGRRHCINNRPKKKTLRDDSINLVTWQTEYRNISAPSTNIESSEANVTRDLEPQPYQNGVINPRANPYCEGNGSGHGLEPQINENGLIGAEANPHSRPTEVGHGLEAQQSENHVGIAGATQQFQLSTIRAATNGFDEANVIGKGAFGVVYKAILPDGQEIAVKMLKPHSCGDAEFKNELSVLAKLQHENLVEFLGFCLEGTEKVLVFEFVKNGSLDHFIFESALRQWEKLYSFILGIVGGLLYLHRDFRHRIIHRDIKPANILLSESLTPKIADFGMAKLFRDDQTHCESSKIKGTFGYLAPEYANCRRFSARSDVYSFGVLVLEIVIGRRNNSADPGVHLLSCAWISLMNDRVSELYDPSILGSNPSAVDQIKRCIHIGLLCVQANEVLRPTMEEIDTWLKDDSVQLPAPLKPPFFVTSESEVLMPVPIVGSSTSGHEPVPIDNSTETQQL